jgi:hypothetical protein
VSRLLLLLALLGLLVAAGTAWAANAPDQRLTAVASEIAGHPVNVWCEASPADWPALVREHNPGASDPDPNATIGAFSAPSLDTTYLGPRACVSLRQAIHAGAPDKLALPAIPLPPAEGLMVLLHESEHHAGHVDEHETECAALGQLRHYLTSLYRWPAKVTVTKRVKRWHYVLVNGKRVRRAYYVRVKRTAPNPKIKQAVSDALRHRLFCVGKVTP